MEQHQQNEYNPPNFENQSELIVQLRLMNNAAYQWVYQKYFWLATNSIRKSGGTVENCREFFQEALFILMKKLAQPDFSLTVNLGTFLYAIVRNQWLQHLRQSARKHPSNEQQPPRTFYPEPFAEKVDTSDAQAQVVSKAMSLLSQECQQVLLLSFYHRMSGDVIAQTLNYSKQFVKVKKHRCLEKLRTLCEEMWEKMQKLG